MRIGLIDCDSHNFPNLPLMKLSAYHKNNGDSVDWYDENIHHDRVYISKVFSFSKDYEEPINSDEIIRGGVRILYRFGFWKGMLRQIQRHRLAV